MNSLLGTIQLGIWELGSVRAFSVTTGSATFSANPSVGLTTLGGTPRVFTAVAGTIRLGIFELGQVPAGSVTAKEVSGKGTFQCFSFPDVAISPPAFIVSLSWAGYPDVRVRGNFGPLLFAAVAFPDAVASSIFYYATSAFTVTASPDVEVLPVTSGSALFQFDPGVLLATDVGEPVSSIVGPESPPGVLSNYVF